MTKPYRFRLNRPLLALAPVQKLLQSRAGATPGPDDARRARSGCTVWGEVRNARGDEAKLALVAPNGYDLTVSASLGIVEQVRTKRPAGGFYTPSLLMGADYVFGLPGVRRIG